MSHHNDPKYQIPELIQALKDHGLDHDKPSQLADAFRLGWTAQSRPPIAKDAAPSIERFNELIGAEADPIERLRFFCSIAMSGQDWLDVEPLFGAITATPAAGAGGEVGESCAHQTLIAHSGVCVDCGATPATEQAAPVSVMGITDADVEAALATFFKTPVFASGHALAMRLALEGFAKSRPDVIQLVRWAYEDAATMVEQEDPRTSDWMWDDRNDLANAIHRRCEETIQGVASPAGEGKGEGKL